jgi:hypothetical protein
MASWTYAGSCASSPGVLLDELEDGDPMDGIATTSTSISER